ncbi:nucleotidyltransferase family protein [Arcobacter sp. FWKO B]|uniref:nucleotidyltransferase family protein n=1 Tax=Arcobacter sp. FWKO B TaxID=2593672 RepID=UPI0018A44D76|nr:nucleotidyltransferase family protein [Arcobacter sp. FWKO B]QOG12083.1 nucleotidyltransferase family protein [Arcobacter sp. FWKO B]
MTALLLSAGLGTRLRPVTNHIPKCLVPINGKVLLEYWLENLTKAGITRFIINTHYFSEKVDKFIEESIYREKVTLVYEEELLLTAGTILNVKDHLNDDSFMVVHADNLSVCDFSAFINAHKCKPKRCEITMMTFETDNPTQCGVISKDSEGLVQEFFEKVKNPPTNLANAAVYIMEPCIISFLESLNKKMIDLSTEVIPHYIGKIYVFHNDVYHRDIGTLESYSLAQIDTLEKKDIF